MKDLIRNRLEELTIEKWWDYGDFEEIRDKDYVADCILEDFHNLILARVKELEAVKIRIITDSDINDFNRRSAIIYELKNLLK